MGDSGIDIHIGDATATPGHCPYCHYVLKPAGVAPCPRCGAGHHPECWAENGGCAVLGCSGRASPRTPAPAPAGVPPSAQPPAPQPPRSAGRSTSTLAAAALIAALAAVGAVGALILTRPSGEPAATTTTATNDAAGPRTVTVFTPSEPAGGDAADGDAPPDGGSTSAGQGRQVVDDSYTVRLPPGWVTESVGVYHAATKPTENSYTESRWHAPQDADTYIHIDYTTGFSGDIGDAARQVRSDYNKGPSYREDSFNQVELASGQTAWRWRYADRQSGVLVEKVDYFTSGCNTGYALLGVTPADRAARQAGVFEDVAGTLRPRC